MATTRVNHALISVVNDDSSVDVIYPKNTSDDVSVTSNKYTNKDLTTVINDITVENGELTAELTDGNNETVGGLKATVSTDIASNIAESVATTKLSGVNSRIDNVETMVSNIESSVGNLTAKIIVTAEAGTIITCTKTGGGSVSVTQTSSTTWECNVEYGEWTVSGTLGSDSASEVINVDTIKLYNVEFKYTHFYGAEWDGTSTTVWSRTDEATEFSNPVPYVSDASSYSSPFDNLYPWSGMVIEERTGGTMVKIPKFWFKWTTSGTKLKLQIANKYIDGFSVSPAHMDRGDGKGERDVVYVGRYHCGSSAYKSVSGQTPMASITRSTARTYIHALGDNIWQMDYATILTIRMLYLVEFADWNSQTKIGYGCSTSKSIMTMGYTDSMPYHTGTNQSSRSTYGGTQYRYIEGLWDNVYDWMDGCYYSVNGMSIILNPNNFDDTTGGTLIGTPSNGYPSAMSVSTVSGYEWVLYPTASGGSSSTYVPDGWYFYSSFPCLYSGGVYDQSTVRGLFFVSCAGASNSDLSIGCRLLELP